MLLRTYHVKHTFAGAGSESDKRMVDEAYRAYHSKCPAFHSTPKRRHHEKMSSVAH